MKIIKVEYHMVQELVATATYSDPTRYADVTREEAEAFVLFANGFLVAFFDAKVVVK